MLPVTVEFVRSACRVPPMTLEEEQAAFERVRAGGADGEMARRCIVEANVRLVVSIAQRLTSRGVWLEDLISTGVVALFETVDRHAKSKHKTRRFSTYAAVRILSHLSDLIRKSGPLGISQRVLSLDQPVSPHMRRVLSLDQPAEGEDAEAEETLGEVVPDENTPPPWADMDAEVVRARLGLALKKLPSRWRQIVDLRFGMSGEALREEEIALRFGVTQPRVAQILKQSFKRLREDLEQHEE